MPSKRTSGRSEDPIDALVAEFIERRDRGETIDPERFLAEHPQHAEELRSVFASWESQFGAAGAGKGAAASPPSRFRTHVPEKASVPGSSAPDAERSAQRRARDATVLGNQAAPADPAALPKQFGRYSILRLLGEGGMGSVYLAHDSQLRRDVALKVPTLTGPDRDELIQRFYREARSAATLRHPNICPVYDVGEIDGRPFLTMAFIDGKPLTRYIQPDRLQNPRNVASLVRKIALGVAEAHRHGIMHRDLKPGNVMIDDRGEPVIMDFGLARSFLGKEKERLTQSGIIIGTPAYMAPEQIAGDSEDLGPQCDVWSLGVIFFELLTGRLPFEGNVLQIVAAIQAGEPPAPSSLRPHVPQAFDAICGTMLTRDPSVRYASMQDVADDLARSLRAGTSDESTFRTRTQTKDKPRDSKMAAFLSAMHADANPTRPPAGARRAAETRRTQPARQTARSPRPLWIAGAAAALILVLVAAVLISQPGRSKAPSGSGSAVPLAASAAIPDAAPDAGPDAATSHDTAGKDIDSELKAEAITELTLVGELTGHAAPVTGLAFGSDRRLFSTSLDGSLRAWDVRARRPAGQWTGHEGPIYVLDVTPSGEVVTGGRDATVRLWDLTAGKERLVIPVDGPVETLAFSAQGRHFSAGSLKLQPSFFGVWSIANPSSSPVRMWWGAGNAFSCATRFGENGLALGWISFGRSLTLWTPETPMNRVPIATGADATCVASAPRSDLVVAGTDRSYLRVMKPSIRASLGDIPAPAIPRSARFAPDGRRLFVGYDANLISTFDLWSGRELSQVRTRSMTNGMLALSPDGSLLASARGGTASEEIGSSAISLWRVPQPISDDVPPPDPRDISLKDLLAGEWKPVWRTAADVAASPWELMQGNSISRSESVRFESGVLTLSRGRLRIPDLKAGNVAIRVKHRNAEGQNQSDLILRWDDSGLLSGKVDEGNGFHALWGGKRMQESQRAERFTPIERKRSTNRTIPGPASQD